MKAQDVIAARILRLFQVSEDDASLVAFGVLSDLLSAPDLEPHPELAAQLNPWRAIETAPKPEKSYGPSWWIIGATAWGPPERRHYWSGPCEWQDVDGGRWEFTNHDFDVFAPPTLYFPLPAPPSEDKS